MPRFNTLKMLYVCFVGWVLSGWVLAGAQTEGWSARDFGAAGDGKQDDTGAIQAAMDRAAEVGGAVVHLLAGTYRIEGSLTVPSGVTLQGIWRAPHHEDRTWGSALFSYAGRGEPEGKALVTLQPSSAIRGVTVYYPDQTADDIQPYPFAIRGSGMEYTVENVTFVNAYQGIDCSPQHELHFIRNVRGCVLHRGIIVDRCMDIGRIENVHFNPHYWARSLPPPGRENNGAMGYEQKLVDYLNQNLEVFVFGRTDWEYVFNTFAWGFKDCYKFIETEAGACNGNFLGIGADGGQHCLWVERTQPPGLLITNGEFVAFTGDNPIEIVTTPDYQGVVQLNNCSFWGPTRQCVFQEGKGVLSLNQCNFQDWGLGDRTVPAIEVTGGELTVSGCLFAKDQAHIRVGKNAGKAILYGNRFPNEERVEILNEE